MFNPEKLLGGLLMGGSRRRSGLGSLVSGGAALGLAGVAMEAVEHFMDKSKASASGQPPPGPAPGPTRLPPKPPPTPGAGFEPPRRPERHLPHPLRRHHRPPWVLQKRMMLKLTRMRFC